MMQRGMRRGAGRSARPGLFEGSLNFTTLLMAQFLIFDMV